MTAISDILSNIFQNFSVSGTKPVPGTSNPQNIISGRYTSCSSNVSFSPRSALALTSCAAPAGDDALVPAPEDKPTVFPIAAASAEPVGTEADERFTDAVSAFSEKLFSLCAADAKQKNLVLSPLSVIYALTLVSNGAADSTLEAFESLNGGIPVSEMNEYLYEFSKKLASTEESTVNTANSVWTNEAVFELNEDFICDFVNLSTSRNIDEIGKKSIMKYLRFIGAYFITFWKLLTHRYALCYLAITCYGIGFLKDAPFVLLCKLFRR